MRRKKFLFTKELKNVIIIMYLKGEEHEKVAIRCL